MSTSLKPKQYKRVDRPDYLKNQVSLATWQCLSRQMVERNIAPVFWSDADSCHGDRTVTTSELAHLLYGVYLNRICLELSRREISTQLFSRLNWAPPKLELTPVDIYSNVRFQEVKVSDKLLGQGTYGRLYLAQHDNTQVVKQLKDAGLNGPHLRELASLRLLYDQPGIIRPVSMSFTQLSLPKYDQNLEDYRLKQAAPNLGQLSDLSRQLIKAVFLMHQRLVCHRDLKTPNIMVDTNGAFPTLYLIDFGMARLMTGFKTDLMVTDLPTIHTKMSRTCSTSWWCAPELLPSHYVTESEQVEFQELLEETSELPQEWKNRLKARIPQHYDPFKLDMWSVGVILLELARGHVAHPFNCQHHYQHIKQLTDQDLPLRKQALLNKIVRYNSHFVHRTLEREMFLDLLAHLLDFYPGSRYTAAQAMFHPFVDYHPQVLDQLNQLRQNEIAPTPAPTLSEVILADELSFLNDMYHDLQLNSEVLILTIHLFKRTVARLPTSSNDLRRYSIACLAIADHLCSIYPDDIYHELSENFELEEVMNEVLATLNGLIWHTTEVDYLMFVGKHQDEELLEKLVFSLSRPELDHLSCERRAAAVLGSTRHPDDHVLFQDLLHKYGPEWPYLKGHL